MMITVAADAEATEIAARHRTTVSLTQRTHRSLPESLTQGLLVGKLLIGGLGVSTEGTFGRGDLTVSFHNLNRKTSN